MAPGGVDVSRDHGRGDACRFSLRFRIRVIVVGGDGVRREGFALRLAVVDDVGGAVAEFLVIVVVGERVGALAVFLLGFKVEWDVGVHSEIVEVLLDVVERVVGAPRVDAGGLGQALRLGRLGALGVGGHCGVGQRGHARAVVRLGGGT